jgi:hypothetical protein
VTPEYGHGMDKPDLICPICRKDFTGFVMSVLRHCPKCLKLIPFLKDETVKVDHTCNGGDAGSR